MKILAGVTLAKVWAEFVRAQNSKWPPSAGLIIVYILSVLAHIAALDLGSGVIWGKEFISDVSFIVLHTAYLDPNSKWPPLAILNTILII